MYSNSQDPAPFPWSTVFLLISVIILIGAIFYLQGVMAGEYEPEIPEWMLIPTPTPTATAPAKYDFQQAEAYFAAGNLDGAVAAYDDVIRKEPTNDVAMIRQSRLLVYTGDKSKAVMRGAEAVALNPNNPENLAYYCRALDWEAKYDEAFEACFCGAELFPDYAESYAFISEVYTDLGNTIQGRNYAEQAIELDPNSLNGHFNLGYALETAGKYQEAAQAYEQAIQIAPNIAQNYIAAGLMYHSLGQNRRYRKLQPYETAIKYFKAAIRLRPFDPEAYARLGWTYYFDGQYERAIDALEQGLGVDPTYSRAWGYLADVYYTRQRYEQVTTSYLKAIDLAENGFLSRAREVEIFTEAPTAAGIEQVPILRGRFLQSANRQDLKYNLQFERLAYAPTTLSSIEQSCAESIAQSILTETLIVEPDVPITFTQPFSASTGRATLDLSTGQLDMVLENLPQLDLPYALKIEYWPNRVDDLGQFTSNESGMAEITVQLNEKLDAPVQYYYQLGLAYAYLDEQDCDSAIPWLQKALNLQPASWNPAWHGVKPGLCYTTDTPPTPIPTPTPLPTETPQ